MPKFTRNMQAVTTANNYTFTAAKIDDLGASEYTLATIICDVSSSVWEYGKELEQCIKTVLESCRQSPRCDNLLLRLCAFNDCLSELHGFKELQRIAPDDYDGILKIDGCTALYEASFEGIDATGRYASALADQDYAVNGIVFIITDGADNSSRRKPAGIAKLIQRIRKEEQLQSLTTVLIGVGADSGLSSYLDNFKNKAALDQYIALGNASKSELAKLAGFISRSISTSSRALAGGSPTASTFLSI